ncbi:WD40 domain-containing protein [Ceratobasidium sp. AG-Ba]|nr:WD40 domain-containing protein [Ceratobasidium sp. AG-Ba]
MTAPLNSLARMTPAYSVAWKLTGEQHKLLTCLALSPSGSRLVVASKDSNILVLDVATGSVLTELSFEGQFSTLAAHWYTETNIFAGCCNGTLYDICFEPKECKSPATMSPILGPFSQQIWAIAFDPARSLLAVSYGNTVGLYCFEVTSGSQKPEWGLLETIKGPCNNESAVVTALLFYPNPPNMDNLFIGYAETGWSVWSKIGTAKRVSPEANHNVTQIGCATLSPDKQSMAISTFDHSIVTYTLGSDGPILSSWKEFTYADEGDIRPIVPVAFTSTGLALGGTACGEVPMIQTSGEMSLIRHEKSDHIIRVIATHGQKVIIGSSNNLESVLTCYDSSVVSHGKSQNSERQFTTVSEALVQWHAEDCKLTSANTVSNL